MPLRLRIAVLRLVRYAEQIFIRIIRGHSITHALFSTRTVAHAFPTVDKRFVCPRIPEDNMSLNYTATLTALHSITLICGGSPERSESEGCTPVIFPLEKV